MSFDLDEEDLKSLKGFNKYEYFDWYDYSKVEKLNQTRSKQWIKLYAKLRKAKEDGNNETFAKTREALRKHEAENKILKKKAEDAGYYWC